ncbi:MFS transporter, partial [Candidatus Bathyarchaeota archaeon]|nr:MFS transporter [Candidatus Bathyarchaeota archaeon]
MEAQNSQVLSASLKCLLFSAFVVQLLMGIVGITTPIYAAKMGASQLLLGVIGAAGGLVYSFVPIAMGAVSDRIRRRKIPIVAAMLLYGTACFIYIFAKDPQILVPIKALELFSVAMFWPSIEALLTETGGENVERTLRKFNLSWSSAAVLGPVIGGILISLYEAKIPFLISSAFSLALAVIAATLVKELPQVKTSHRHSPLKFSGGFGLIIMAIVSVLLFSFVLGIIFNLFPAHATIIGIP